MKKCLLILLVLFSAGIFAQNEKIQSESYIGQVVRISGDINGFGIVLQYQADDFIELGSLDGSESRSILLGGVKYRIDVLAKDKEEYEQLKATGVIKEEQIVQEIEKAENEWRAQRSAQPTVNLKEMKKAARHLTSAQRKQAVGNAKHMIGEMKEEGRAQEALQKAQTENNRSAYEKVVRKYPESLAAQEAQRRLTDPIHAFLVTCKLGNADAFAGYNESFPASGLKPMADSFLQFYRQLAMPNSGGIRKFIAQFPENPFGPAALALVPAEFLKKAGAKVAVRIHLANVVRKGLLAGSLKPEKVRSEIWQTIEAALAKEGIGAVLIEEESGQAVVPDECNYLLDMDYSESKIERNLKFRFQANSLSEGLFRAAVAVLLQGLDELLFSSAKASMHVSIIEHRENKNVFCDVHDITLISPIGNMDFIHDLAANPRERLACLALALGLGGVGSYEEGVSQVIAGYLAAVAPQ